MIDPQCDATDVYRFITPADFFSTDHEKIKLNWFLFEYALECAMFIQGDRKLLSRLEQKGVNAQAVASFYIHHAKQMKNEIIDRLSGKSSANIPFLSLPLNVTIGFYPSYRENSPVLYLRDYFRIWP